MRHVRTVLIICAIALLLRILLIAQSPTFTYEGYSMIRQVEHIKETGLPLTEDALSYGGRAHLLLPVFPYAIAFGTIFLPDNLAYLLIPNLFAVGLHAALFFLILELTNDSKLSALGGVASIFIPSYLGATLLTLSSLSLAVPLLIVMLTLFLKLRKTNEKRMVLLIAFLVLSLTHPLALLCIPLFIITLTLSTINRSRDEVAQKEFALFATFLLLWLYALIYKQSLLSAGFETLRGNIPTALRNSIYGSVSLGGLAAMIGIIPFGLALYTAYKEAAGKHVGIQATIALAITIGLAMLAHIIPLNTGLVLLSAVAIALATVGLQHMRRYAKSLKRSPLPKIGMTLLAALFVMTSVLQTVTTGFTAAHDNADPAVVAAAEWLRENSLQESIVLAEPRWGFLIEEVAERRAYMDEDYLGVPDIDQRYQDTQLMLSGYNTARLARQHRIDYIVAEQEFTDTCLNTVYTRGVHIMKVLCR